MKTLLTVFLFALSALKYSKCSRLENLEPKTGTFFYFAYGSNMFSNRMHINCPTSEFITIAELEGWQLDFRFYVSFWDGSVANITPNPSTSVWGVVWQIDNSEMRKLDGQELVNLGTYYPANVTVTTREGGKIQARTYIEFPPKPHQRTSYKGFYRTGVLPQSEKPSRTYHRVILYGGIQHRLPAAYIDVIDSFVTNGRLATPEMRVKLGYPFNEILK